MDRETLAARLAEGRSIESIARETGRAPSTVAYWVNKYGLMSQHAARHAPRGGIERDQLEALVEEGLSVRQIAARCDVSATTVRHWLQRLRAQDAARALRPARPAEARTRFSRNAARHGWGSIRPPWRDGRVPLRALQRRRPSPTRRRRVKEILVAEAGGSLRHLRVRRLRRGSPVPPPRSGDQGVRGQPPGDHPFAAAPSLGGPEMRATVRELPRDGRGRVADLPVRPTTLG